jgi:acyl-coenzyme A thioesterase PaaI-like protein
MLRRFASRTFSTAAADGVTPTSVINFMKKQWPDNPYDDLQHLTFYEISGKHVLFSQNVQSYDQRPGGFISGPSQFCMCDVGMWVAVFGAKGFNKMAMTSEMSIRYLRPAVGTKLWSRIDINSVGSRTLVMTATQWTSDQDKPTSVAQGTYVMPKSEA